MSEYDLVKTKKIWGATRTSLWLPQATTTKNALFMPDGHPAYGLYDENGQIAPASAAYHGPERHLFYPPEPTSPVQLSRTETEYAAGSYIYCGLVLAHYGHSLLSTLSRYWFLAKEKRSADKILYHGNHPFSFPYLAFWLTHCGLNEGDFVNFAAPTHIEEVRAISSAFEELWYAHKVFAELCQLIAKNAGAAVKRNRSLPPVYLSKSQVASGVGKFLNEAALEVEMANLGARVVYPEQLSMSDQISLFHEAPVILGAAGSAMHTSLFVKGGSRMVAVTYQDVIHSNNILIDKISGNKTIYVTPATEQVEAVEGFQLTYEFKDVKATARSLMAWGQTL